MKYDTSYKYYAEWKKPDTKGHILYASIHMKCPSQSRGSRYKQVNSFQGWGGGREPQKWEVMLMGTGFSLGVMKKSQN